MRLSCWARTRAVAVLAFALPLSGCLAGAARHSQAVSSLPSTSLPVLHSSAASRSAPPRTTRTAIPITAAPADQAQAGTDLASAVLAGLPVKGRAPMTGYDRDAFGSAWTDDNLAPGGHNGCDTRNDVLGRDLTQVVFKSGTRDCAVLSGTLHDPYTGRVIDFVRGPKSIDVQIDHVVALGDAWQTGAQRLSPAERVELANDPLELLAVDGPTNEQKGDGDAATWLPPDKAYRCAYVARQVAVKHKYRLWVTAAERDAIARILARCPTQTVPQEAGAQVVPLVPRTTPTPTRTVTQAAPILTTPGCTRTSSGKCIRGGELCSRDSYGQTGTDAEGRSYRCQGDPSGPHWENP